MNHFCVVYKQRFDKEVVSAALHEYFVINFKEDCKHLFMVWTPLTIIMFAAVPPRWRIPWLDFCGLGWVTLLSVKRGEEHKESDQTANAVTESERTLDMPTSLSVQM